MAKTKQPCQCVNNDFHEEGFCNKVVKPSDEGYYITPTDCPIVVVYLCDDCLGVHVPAQAE